MNPVLAFMLSYLLISIEVFHDASRATLEYGSYDKRIDYFTKGIKAFGILVGLAIVGDLTFAVVYLVTRILLFDILYHYTTGRSFKGILKNYWLFYFFRGDL